MALTEKTKLELKHLTPYLPYGLKAVSTQDIQGVLYKEINLTERFFSMPTAILTNFKIILRPFSDLTKEITVNNEDFVPYEHSTFVEAIIANEYLKYLCEAKADLSEDRWIPYSVVQLLFEWHFDVFGLIDQDLAIDINKK